MARHYNPAIARIGGELVMVWRVQNAEGYSRIVWSRLRKQGGALKQGIIHELALPAPAKAHLEDPRLVQIGERILLFIAEVVYGATFTFVLRCFELDADFAVRAEIPLPYYDNGRKTQKNWMPFELPGGKLGLVYSLRPHIVIAHDDAGQIHATPGIPRWKWGTLSGRTNAVRLDESRYLALIGGHCPHPRRKSVYWVGAYTFAAAAPHAVLGVSQVPILWASDQDPAVLNPFDPNWNPLVVFPAGLVLDGDAALVSLGLNDSYCALMRWPLEELLAGLVPPESITGQEQLTAAPGAPAPGGMVRVRVTHGPNGRVRHLGEPGGPYKSGEEFFTTHERAQALGPLVEPLA